MIADEAVEAAAKVLASHAYPISLDKPYEAAARAALEAGAPYMLVPSVVATLDPAHSMHAEGEYFYACEACSGLPDGDRQ